MRASISTATGRMGRHPRFCESTWDGVQDAVPGACDQDKAFDAIVQRVVQLGRSLRDKKAASIGWHKYGSQKQFQPPGTSPFCVVFGEKWGPSLCLAVLKLLLVTFA